MSSISLAELKPRQKARIVSVGQGPDQSKAQEEDALVRALLEIGILEGSEIEILHEAPLSRDPIAVQVRGALIALRRQEAALVRVEILP